jgi:hypothetical protein
MASAAPARSGDRRTTTAAMNVIARPVGASQEAAPRQPATTAAPRVQAVQRPHHEAALRHRRAATIELAAAAALGDHAARWALSVLAGVSRAGRPGMDDAAALAEVQRLEREGNRSAVHLVAMRLAIGGTKISSIERRLRRKRELQPSP